MKEGEKLRMCRKFWFQSVVEEVLLKLWRGSTQFIPMTYFLTLEDTYTSTGL